MRSSELVHGEAGATQPRRPTNVVPAQTYFETDFLNMRSIFSLIASMSC